MRCVNFPFSLRDDAVATAELNEFVLSRVCEQIAPHRTSPNLVSEMSPCMSGCIVALL